MAYHYGVEGALVDDCVEGVLREFHGAHVHLYILEVGPLLLVEFVHGLDGGLRDVDVGDVLVAVVEHLLAEAWVGAGVRELPDPTLRMRNSTGMLAPMISRRAK